MTECLLFTDESGNHGEAWQVLAGIGGEKAELELLELRLRTVLERRGIAELKWAGLRTREKRHDAAREFLQLACEAAGEGKLWVDLLVLEHAEASGGWQALELRERWMALYMDLIKRARRRRPRARWALHPDQRTGMPWKRLARIPGIAKVEESSSSEMALIQLADLLAGLTRFSHEITEGRAEKARLKREKLLGEFTSMLAQGKLGDLKGAGRGRRAFRLHRLRNLSRGKHA